MAASDNIIYVNTSAARTLTLPAPTNGRILFIKDSTGGASSHNILVNPHVSETIDGSSSFTINQNWGELQLQSDGTNWFTNQAPTNPNITFPLFAPDGSATVPEYSFTNATTTGIYKFAANSIGFTTNGVTAGNISASQNWTFTGSATANGGFLSSPASGTSPIDVTATSARGLVVRGTDDGSNGLIQIRPNNGGNGYLSWVEAGVGIRGFLGFNAGSGTLNYIPSSETGTVQFSVDTNGVIVLSSGTSNQHTLNTKLATNGSGVLTLTNGPSGTSGNPTGYIQITINGSTRNIPFW